MAEAREQEGADMDGMVFVYPDEAKRVVLASIKHSAYIFKLIHDTSLIRLPETW